MSRVFRGGEITIKVNGEEFKATSTFEYNIEQADAIATYACQNVTGSITATLNKTSTFIMEYRLARGLLGLDPLTSLEHAISYKVGFDVEIFTRLQKDWFSSYRRRLI